MSPVQARPMTESDVGQAASVSAAAFEIDLSEPSARSRWESRTRHALLTDPEGAFVTEHAGVVVGVAQAIIRERLWILSLLTVSPTLERTGGGDGRALVNAALAYDRDTDISGAQQWAIEVLLAARLPFQSRGAIAVRGNPGPLTPYIPTPPVA